MPRRVPCLVVSSVMLLAACGSTAGTTTTTAASTPGTAAPAPTTTAASSTTAATTTTVDPMAEHITFRNEATGISSVIPPGLVQVATDVYAVGDAGIAFWSFPHLDAGTAVASWSRVIVGEPEHVGDFRTEGLSWQIYGGSTRDGDHQWYAVSPQEDELHVVAMRVSEIEGNTWYDDVLLPALNQYAFSAPDRPAESAEHSAEHRIDFVYDASQPLDLVIETTEQDGDLTVQVGSYASPKGGRVPASIWVPPGSGPFPAVVLQHGLPSSKEGVADEARSFAGAGVLVVAIDAPHARPEAQGREDAITLDEQDADDQVQLIVDIRRAVDLLEARPDVDPARIGYVGISYGAAMGGLVAAMEHRLAACVLVVGDGGLVSHLTGSDDEPPESRPGWQAWFDVMWPIEPLHFVADAAMPLLYQSGLRDEQVPFPDAIAYQRAGPAHAEVRWYDSGHGLPDQAWLDQAQWLAQYLLFDPGAFTP
jgi:dienelactone hydrolase